MEFNLLHPMSQGWLKLIRLLANGLLAGVSVCRTLLLLEPGRIWF